MKKIQNRYIWILLAAIMISLAACEKEIRFYMDDYTPKIVMNGIISPDSLIEIGLSRSFLYNDTSSGNSLLKNATLTLFINGEEREKMQMTRMDTVYDSDRSDYYYKTLITVFSSTVRPKTGDRIRIEASAEGFNPAWAETTIPIPPIINKIDTATFFTSKNIFNSSEKYTHQPNSNDPDHIRSIATEEYYRNMRVKMDVTYPLSSLSNQDQHFTLQLKTMVKEPPYMPIRGEEEYYLYIYTDDDPIFEESSHHNILDDMVTQGSSFKGLEYLNFLFFSDKRFQNHNYTFDFSITGYYDIITTFNVESDPGVGIYDPRKRMHTEVLNPPVEVLFTVISPELYSYFRMKGRDLNSSPLGFVMLSEPEPTLSNVHDGIGIVGAVSGTKALINIPSFPGGREKIPRWE